MSGSGNISVTYDDSAGTITIAEALTTTDITEGDNLYLQTQEQMLELVMLLLMKITWQVIVLHRFHHSNVKAYVDSASSR